MTAESEAPLTNLADSKAESRARIAAVLEAIFARRAADDFDGVLEYAAPDIVCFPPSTWSHARYPATIRGKDAVREALRRRLTQYELLPMTIHRILIDGDEAIIHRTRRLRERGGGPVFEFDCVNILRFRDGLVIEMHEYPDGAGRDLVANYPL